MAASGKCGGDSWVDDAVSIFDDDWGIDLSRTSWPRPLLAQRRRQERSALAIERLIAEIPGASLRVWSGEGNSAPARHLDDILHDLIDAADGER
jgi:hypothetical protein